jgi:hypothetical protein
MLLGRGIYGKSKNLGTALQLAYPEYEWDISKFSYRGKKSVQRWLRLKVNELLANYEIFEDFSHPKLRWGILFFKFE